MSYKHIMLFVLCGASSQSTSSSISTTVRAEQQMQNTIMIQITAEPLEFSMKERESFKVGIEAKNVGNKAINPKLYETVLLVNGQPSFAWGSAISNGPREEAWWNLQPGDTITASWPLGEAMFTQPGEYEVVLRLGVEESSVYVRVTQ
jgi:hypothetical protein